MRLSQQKHIKTLSHLFLFFRKNREIKKSTRIGEAREAVIASVKSSIAKGTAHTNDHGHQTNPPNKNNNNKISNQIKSKHEMTPLVASQCSSFVSAFSFASKISFSRESDSRIEIGKAKTLN